MRKSTRYFCWTGNDTYLAIEAIIFDFFNEKDKLTLNELTSKIIELREKRGLDLYLYSGNRCDAVDFITFVSKRLQIIKQAENSYELTTDARNLRKYRGDAFKKELLKLSYSRGEHQFSDFNLFVKELLKKYNLFGKMVQKSNLRGTLKNFGLASGGNKYILPYLVSLGVLKDSGIYYEINADLLLAVDDVRIEILRKMLQSDYESKVKEGKLFTYEDALCTFIGHDFSDAEAEHLLKELHSRNAFVIHQSGNMRILRM